MALYALATLFNYPKKIPLGVKVLWAPILLVHLGGQDCITAYNIEDNEMWKRHVLTAMSQVSTTALLIWSNIPYIPILSFIWFLMVQNHPIL
jgi:hypothetical protein